LLGNAPFYLYRHFHEWGSIIVLFFKLLLLIIYHSTSMLISILYGCQPYDFEPDSWVLTAIVRLQVLVVKDYKVVRDFSKAGI